LIAVFLGAGSAAGAPPTGTGGSTYNSELDQFCARAQASISGVKVPAVNVVHTDFDAFVLSKPAVRPLQTQQFHWYTTRPEARMRVISCKMKSADHIRTEYGPDQVGEQGSCAALNRQTLDRVLASFSDAERRQLKFDRGRDVVIDADDRATSAAYWLQPYAIAYIGAGGALHLQSRSIHNDWLDPRLADMAPRFKGVRYCHLIAPAYLRDMLLGEIPAEVPTDFPSAEPSEHARSGRGAERAVQLRVD